MPGDVYSERFVATAGIEGWHNYTVPPGKRAIVKTVTMVCFTEPGPYIICEVGGWPVMRVFFQVAGDTKVFNCHIVAYAQEMVRLYTAGTLTGGCISGFLLDDLPGRRRDPEVLPAPPTFAFEPYDELYGQVADG